MRKYIFYISILLNVLFLIAGIVLVRKLGGINNLVYRIKHRGLGELYEHRKNLFENMVVSDSSIVFLGNSITAQCEWAELFQNPNIINRGIPGDHAVGVLERLDFILNGKPEKIFLMIGFNDLLFDNGQLLLDTYEKIISRILNESPHTQLFIQSILPVNNAVKNTTIKNESILAINKQIHQIALNNQLTFLDLYPRFTDEEGNLDAAFTMDGIHLNGEAYLVWRDAIEVYVQSLDF